MLACQFLAAVFIRWPCSLYTLDLEKMNGPISGGVRGQDHQGLQDLEGERRLALRPGPGPGGRRQTHRPDRSHRALLRQAVWPLPKGVDNLLEVERIIKWLEDALAIFKLCNNGNF